MNDESKYQRTGPLLRAAIDAGGYKYPAIAEKARLSGKSKSLVGRWVHGKATAKRSQLAYFINKYEHLIGGEEKHLFRSCPKGDAVSKYFTCEGKLLLNHPSYEYHVFRGKLKRVAVKRVRVITKGDAFWLVLQNRVVADPDLKAPSGLYVRGDNESALWWSDAKELSLEGLLDWADRGLEEFYGTQQRRSSNGIEGSSFISDRKTIPFSIREMLLKMGYSLESLEGSINDNLTG